MNIMLAELLLDRTFQIGIVFIRLHLNFPPEDNSILPTMTKEIIDKKLGIEMVFQVKIELLRKFCHLQDFYLHEL